MPSGLYNCPPWLHHSWLFQLSIQDCSGIRFGLRLHLLCWTGCWMPFLGDNFHSPTITDGHGLWSQEPVRSSCDFAIVCPLGTFVPHSPFIACDSLFTAHCLLMFALYSTLFKLPLVSCHLQVINTLSPVSVYGLFTSHSPP